MSRLNEIKEREEKATEGPWKSDVRSGCMAVYAGEWLNCLAGMERCCIRYKHGHRNNDDTCWEVEDQDVEDNEFIAHSREDIPWLVQKVEEAILLAEYTAKYSMIDSDMSNAAKKWLEEVRK